MHHDKIFWHEQLKTYLKNRKVVTKASVSVQNNSDKKNMDVEMIENWKKIENLSKVKYNPKANLKMKLNVFEMLTRKVTERLISRKIVTKQKISKVVVILH